MKEFLKSVKNVKETKFYAQNLARISETNNEWKLTFVNKILLQGTLQNKRYENLLNDKGLSAFIKIKRWRNTKSKH